MKHAIGLIGGFLCWYGAHELGLYFSAFDCLREWILPTIHVVSWIACLVCAWISYRLWQASGQRLLQTWTGFSAGVGTAAALLFSIVILWQGIAAFMFSGCER